MSIAFVFPGQGSQYVGMGKEFYQSCPQAVEIFNRADTVLGFPLARLCFEGPAEELAKTANTQPAVLTVSIACLEIFKNTGGPVPAALAGHSLGEYTALVAANAVSFEDAVSLVRKRGQYMQETVPLGTGGMAAVMGIASDAVQEVCRKASSKGIVEAVNLNCPGQVIVAGNMAGLEAAEQEAKKAGAKRFTRLPVSAPFHTSLMVPAGERLARDLAKVKISDPEIPVVANVSADFVRTGMAVKDLLIKQVYSAVRWEESIRFLCASGIKAFIEIGPGKVLSGLIRKINREVLVYNVEDRTSLEKVLALNWEVS